MSVITSSGSGNFSVVCAGAAPGNTVVIAEGHTVTLDGNYTFGDDPTGIALTVNGTLQSDSGTNWTLTLIGTMYVNSSGLFDPGGVITLADGTLVIQAQVAAGYLRVELSDGNGDLQAIFAHTVESAEWSYRRQGGCEAAEVRLIAAFEDYSPNNWLDYDLRLVLEGDGGPVVWWRGYVTRAWRELGDLDLLKIEAKGWAERLESLSVVGLGFPEEEGGVIFEESEYSDIYEIVEALLDRTAPFTGITYDSDSIPTTGFSLERIQFNGSVLSAILDLARIAGNAEFCVDRNKKAHFIAKSSAVRHLIFSQKNAVQVGLHADAFQLLNRVYLRGGDLEGAYENEDDYVADQSQATQDSTRAFGMSTTYQKLLQRFIPGEPTFSQIELKLAKTGFGATTSEGFETSVGGWTALNGVSRIDLDSINPYAGSQSLKVYHVPTSGKFGAYSNYTVSAVEQRVNFQIRTQWEQVTIEICDGSGANGSGATILDTVTLDKKTATWTNKATSVTPSGTTLGIRAYASNAHGGIEPFWLDAVKITPAGAGVKVTLQESLTGGLYRQWGPSATIPFEDIPDTTATALTVKLMPPYLSTINTMGIQVESLGTLSDSAYFLLGTSSAGGYANGYLEYHNGTSWAQDGTRDAYFVTRLPATQQTYGIRSEVLRNPNILSNADAELYCKALIQSRQAPITSAEVEIAPGWDTMIEAQVPLGLAQVPGLMTSALRPERINYRWGDDGMTVGLELGAVLPSLAELINYFDAKLALEGAA